MTARQRECKTCLFFNPMSEDGENGECRRHPPQSFMMAMPTGTPILGAPGKMNNQGIRIQFPAAWPGVKSFAWCGDYEGPVEKEVLDMIAKGG